MLVLVTGADGFIGRHLQQTLTRASIRHRVAVRRSVGETAVPRFDVGDIGPHTNWDAALEGVDVVVHLAGRAHILREHARDPRAEFMRVNAEGTAALAKAAARCGVGRIVYMSSIGVLGNRTGAVPFNSQSPPQPHSTYAESKLAGESAARAEARAGLQVAVVRPPLVYGSFVRANFLRLMNWVAGGRPLPLGAVRNLRSLVSVWNLCDLLTVLLRHPAAAREAWLVSDGEDLSTPELIRRIGAHLKRRVYLPHVPVAALRAAARLAGKGAQFEQLCGSLILDSTATLAALGWTPAISVDEGLERTTQWYASQERTLR
jgi:nucleoside-diphosphate-sugar epimerase